MESLALKHEQETCSVGKSASSYHCSVIVAYMYNLHTETCNRLTDIIIYFKCINRLIDIIIIVNASTHTCIY